jgi:hypothetical protein
LQWLEGFSTFHSTVHAGRGPLQCRHSHRCFNPPPANCRCWKALPRVTQIFSADVPLRRAASRVIDFDPESAGLVGPEPAPLPWCEGRSGAPTEDRRHAVQTRRCGLIRSRLTLGRVLDRQGEHPPFRISGRSAPPRGERRSSHARRRREMTGSPQLPALIAGVHHRSGDALLSFAEWLGRSRR